MNDNVTTEDQQIIADFLKHCQAYGSVRGISIKKILPNLGEIKQIYKPKDPADGLGKIKVCGVGTIEISSLPGASMASFIGFISELEKVRMEVEKICKKLLPKHNFALLIDWKCTKGTRMYFRNTSCQNEDETKSLMKKLRLLGYYATQDNLNICNMYVAKYSEEYSKKSPFERFLYGVTHIFSCF